ncbi:MAG: helix-turn-helix domain-containing protein [Bacteroidota bacterium]
MTPYDKKWLSELEKLVLSNLANPDLDNAQVAAALDISESTLHRRVVELTDLSPAKYIRLLRLRQAKELLLSGEYRTVKVVALAVGFLKVAYFSKQYETTFGQRPVEVIRSIK